MKAKLIIDMPDNCSLCPLANIAIYHWSCDASLNIKPKDEDARKKRHSDCPLIPIHEIIDKSNELTINDGMDD